MNFLSRLVGWSKVDANQVAATSPVASAKERMAGSGMELANGELPTGRDRERFLAKT